MFVSHAIKPKTMFNVLHQRSNDKSPEGSQKRKLAEENRTDDIAVITRVFVMVLEKAVV